MILMFGKQNNFSLKNIQIASLSAYTALLTVFLVNLVAVFLSILQISSAFIYPLYPRSKAAGMLMKQLL